MVVSYAHILFPILFSVTAVGARTIGVAVNRSKRAVVPSFGMWAVLSRGVVGQLRPSAPLGRGWYICIFIFWVLVFDSVPDGGACVCRSVRVSRAANTMRPYIYIFPGCFIFACCREVVQAAFVEAAGLSWGQPGVDSLRSKLRARQSDLQLSMAAADSVVKETIR